MKLLQTIGSAFDRVVSVTDPVKAVQRAQARRVFAIYEAAKPTKQRQKQKANQSPSTLVGTSATALRAHARFLERNHDLSRGALRTLVNNVVGPNGIGIEPQPRRKDGTIHKEYAAALREARRDWQRCPEVTHRHSDAQMQRLVAKTWLRDGEAFTQTLMGRVPGLDHGTKVPFSLEMFEPDMVPLDYDDPGKFIRQGMEFNAWGRCRAYWVYKSDPREQLSWLNSTSALKRISADNVLHLAQMDRIGQARGISEFASVITRGEDLKEYEESERIAAKVAASMTAYVKRLASTETGYTGEGLEKDENGHVKPRDLYMEPGMIIDDLVAGEEIGMINSNRPNPNLIGWRAGQLRAFAAGIGTSYSSLSRDYNGTYSAQRQELVEQWVNYSVLADDFAAAFVQPAYDQFVIAAHLSGVVPIPLDVKPGTENDCLLVGQSMPWINPMHEAAAWEKLVQAGFASEVEVIRKRGANPNDVLEQIAAFRDSAKEKNLAFSSNAATKQTTVSVSAVPTELQQEAADNAQGKNDKTAD
ncbi:phage portal protein [Polaromonas naphthalenivorans]|uniref:Phage portal protein, lambda family n=1 Tax=Polaromonas naphthalenivorans (strain CJ2) TaxID=365044 RepID=A1VPI4_POLNA|nr:phage portal protein [Polaromonas naphthalenivorans]ABM37562.1 phage portal protein, lambda family [Polaromonas naphthalenivorans CJ2]